MLAARIGEILKQRRLELRIKQDDLAVLSGASQGYISDFENGKLPNLSLETLENLCQALGVQSEVVIMRAKYNNSYKPENNTYMQELNTLCTGLSIRSIKTIIGLAEDLRESEAEQSKAKIG
jgi:transcriptional regulator with XRE-family HTH domain